MEVLRHFHLLNLQGKLPVYSFYRALEFQTDSTGLATPPVNSLIFLFNCTATHSYSGSHGTIYVDGQGVEAFEDGQTRRSSVRSGRSFSNCPGFPSNPLPCLSAAQYQSPPWVGECTARTRVSVLFVIVVFVLTELLPTGGYICLLSPWMPTSAYRVACEALCSNIHPSRPAGLTSSITPLTQTSSKTMLMTKK